MMPGISFTTLAAEHGGILLNGDAAVQSLSIDSRSVRPGDTFIAVAGPRFDGHAFAQAAIEKGATGLVVERQIQCDAPQWLVENCVAAMALIAKRNRAAFKRPLIGITGSNGKTTVKEMLSSILSTQGEVLRTRGNLNNHLGVPLMLSELAPVHEFAVIEMGASAIGEIALLADMARPDVALVTRVGHAHLQGFGSRRGILEGKGEIYEALRPSGAAVINLDGWGARHYLQRARSQVLTYSIDPHRNADVTVSERRLHARGSDFTLSTPIGDVQIALSLLGRHNIGNAAAAATCALAVGLGLAQIKAGLERVEAVAGRLNPMAGPKGSTLLDDAYNASPESVDVAIEVLSNCPGKRVLVLGAMAELGDATAEFHRQVGTSARTAGVQTLICVGDAAAVSAESFGSGAICVGSREEAAERCLQLAAPGVTFLIKGSRSAGLDQLISMLNPAREASCSIG